MDDGQIHALEVRVRQLEEAVARLNGVEPPKPKRVEPYVEKPHRPYDPTVAMGMPASTLEEMARLGCGDPMGDAAALSAGRGMVKQGPSRDPSQQRGVGTRGWIEPAPLQHHGQSYGDGVVDAIGGAGKGGR
jgi:hypothetical protein